MVRPRCTSRSLHFKEHELRSECTPGRLNEVPVTLDDGAILHVPLDDEDPATRLSGARSLHPPVCAFESSRDSEDDHSRAHSYSGARLCNWTQHGPPPSGSRGTTELGRFA